MAEDLTLNRVMLRDIWRERIHVRPEALKQSPTSTREAYEHVWAPAEALLKEMERFPSPWLRLWLESGRGHIILTHTDSAYYGNWLNWRDEQVPSVCYICITDLLQQREAAFHTLLNLFDHLLGSSAKPGQGWFSSGVGITPEIIQASDRFLRIHHLGYGHSELGVIEAADYFSHSFWLYLNNPRELNRLDPLVHRLYHSELIRLPL